MEQVSRRKFLKKTSQIGMGTVMAGAVSTAANKVLGANERVRVACVGLRGRGRWHMKSYVELRNLGVEVAALCDVDEHILNERAEELNSIQGTKPALFRDIRKLLEDDSIDAVSIATPNHWHALVTIWSCQAGKDVYVEKPVSWCIDEGRKMVEAARKYGRIVQVGTQARSFPHIQNAINELQNGAIGDVYMARALCYKRRDSIGFKETGAPPEYLNFDQWLGPAQKQPYHANLVHYNWHWFWNFGNGDIGNQAVHEIDLARWGMGKGLPVKVSCTGGRFGYEDQGETPNTQNATFTYEDGKTIICETRGRFTNAEQGVQLGNLYYGSKGYLAGANWGGSAPQHMDQNQELANWMPRLGVIGDNSISGTAAPENAPIASGPRPDFEENDLNHYRNFIETVCSRNLDNLNAYILEGHISATMVHMANIAYRLGHTLEFDPKTEKFIGHGASQANRFLKRNYREPFMVPDEV